MTQHGDDLAGELRAAARDRGVGRVLRHQPYLAAYLPIGLDRALKLDPVDRRGHDVAVAGRLVQRADHYIVTGDNASADHRVPDDLENE